MFGGGNPAPATPSAEETRARLEALLTLTADAVVSIDAGGIVETFNGAAERLFGYAASEVIGRNVSTLMPEPDASRHCAYIERYLRTGQTRIIGIGRETVARRKDGSAFPIALAVTESIVAGRHIFTGVMRDLSGAKQAQRTLDEYRAKLEILVAERTAALLEANRRLEALALTDPLTGLANRRHFDLVLEARVAHARRTGYRLCLLLCDVDHFKEYNDRYGHPSGDVCLQAIAGVFSTQFRRSTDLIARYGGEEFAVVLSETSPARAGAFAEALREAVWKLALPHEASAVAPQVTISVGIALLDGRRDDSAAALLARADDALYGAKRRGRNRVAWAARDLP